MITNPEMEGVWGILYDRHKNPKHEKMALLLTPYPQRTFHARSCKLRQNWQGSAGLTAYSRA